MSPKFQDEMWHLKWVWRILFFMKYIYASATKISIWIGFEQLCSYFQYRHYFETDIVEGNQGRRQKETYFIIRKFTCVPAWRSMGSSRSNESPCWRDDCWPTICQYLNCVLLQFETFFLNIDWIPRLTYVDSCQNKIHNICSNVAAAGLRSPATSHVLVDSSCQPVLLQIFLQCSPVVRSQPSGHFVHSQ